MGPRQPVKNVVRNGNQSLLNEKNTVTARSEIAERVKKIVVERLNVSADRIVDEAKFREDLNADSLDVVELVMALEEEFGCEIPDSDAEGLVTFGKVVDYVQKASSPA